MSQPVNPVLIKTCNACGLQKPLSAFLQISGPQGAEYGNICSSCRKAHLQDAAKKPTEAENGTTGETGKRIDNKSKTHSDLEQRLQHEEVEADYHENRDRQESLSTDALEKREGTLIKQREHRDSFLNKRAPIDKKGAVKGFGDVAREVQQTNQATNALKDEKRSKEISYDVPYVASQMGEIKFQTAETKKILALFGKTPATVKNAAAVVKNPEKFGVKPADTTEEFIENNWQGPNSTRRR